MELERLKQLAGVNEAEQETMKGTNCSNCKFTRGQDAIKVEDSSKELNEQGGSKPENDEQMATAKQGDLITMPGKKMATHKVMCAHPKMKQYVTERMCCAYWDAPGTLRAYGKQAIGKS